MMRIAFCITCKGRVQHIRKTLLKNIQHNQSPHSFFVLLDYNSNDGLYEHIRDCCQAELASGKLVYFQYRKDVPFHMTHAKNMAHRLGILEGADILVNLDADNKTGEDFDKYILEMFEKNLHYPKEVFLWAKMVKGVLTRGINGRICVTKHAFLLAGGYDEKYNVHSPDDKDFNARLKRMGFEGIEIDQKYLQAIYHDDELRYKEYPHILNDPSCIEYEEQHVSCTNRVVNNGFIGCGTVYRNFADWPITLLPVPTRIFGIGMHKTATCSLDTAMQILGYKSSHWETPRWARNIWHEMRTLGYSPTVENYHALSDLPIPLFYKELDKLYPNAKFILTVRHEQKWLQSVEKHFSHVNPFFKTWNEDCFTHRVHRELYGRKNFDRDIFLSRYRKHNEEVIKHFKGREESLLVLDMEKKDQWQQLSSFLITPVPSVEYPREFVSDNHILAKV